MQDIEQPYDLLLHLGDISYGREEIASFAAAPMRLVRGNNDTFLRDVPISQDFTLGAFHIFMTHGHCQMPMVTLEFLKKEAVLHGANVVLYGHTHRPAFAIKDGIAFINPGSLSCPRQEGRNPTYIRWEINESAFRHNVAERVQKITFELCESGIKCEYGEFILQYLK
jgi:putative phosphoesterase